MLLLSEFEFGSYLSYTPRPETDIQKQSKNLMYSLKTDQKAGNPPEHFSTFVVRQIKENLHQLPFNDFFGSEVALVPVPKSSKMQDDSLWVPSRLVKELVAQRLGTEFDCLKRIMSVNKSAIASNENRPKAEDHYNSLECKKTLYSPKRILLIDDVVTRGATLFGCANKLKDTFPEANIIAFSVMRTVSNTEDFTEIQDSCVGTIRLMNNDTFRVP